MLEIVSSLMKDVKDAQMLSKNLATEFLAQKCSAAEPEIISTQFAMAFVKSNCELLCG